ncbi:MAG: thioesterase family protein [Spirochaetota bacterium]
MKTDAPAPGQGGDMEFPGITTGLSRTINHTVGHRDTAGNFLPDDVEPLLSTSGLVNLAIEASVGLIDPLLPDGFISIGKSSTITHEHPSVLGATLAVTVTITEFDGYHITLRLVASDETGVVGTGVHVRSIVNKHWLQVRVAGRAAESIRGRERR